MINLNNLTRAKELALKTLMFSLQSKSELKPQDVKAARSYLEQYWMKLQRFHPKDDGNLMGLPHPYLVPSYAESQEFDYDELYYWDSYFMVQGMLDAEHKELVMGILEDLLDIFQRFKIIPNGSRLYYTSRSQPPFLTSFIFDVYDAYELDKKWLKRTIDVAEAEYRTVWMGKQKPNARQVYQGLSRYYDFNYLHEIAETESGWDMTPRFHRRCMDYLPVDLNALLYKYETDFARAAEILGDKPAAEKWERVARTRRKAVDELMWDRIRGLYYDYDFKKERRGNISSLAAYYPMWAGMADKNQAAALVRALRRFENKGGLATTDALPVRQYMRGSMPTQWAYPNGWAPLHLLTIRALERYGYHQDARRIAMKWLKCNLAWFKAHGIFLEKYNVASPDKPPMKGIYPAQSGFGWTNAVFERLCQDYIDKAA
jgi:alpha,alpha-trehalase